MRLNGDVDTATVVPSSGIEMINGKRGTDRLKEGSTGFTIEAIACRTTVLDFNETFKDGRVMRQKKSVRFSLDEENLGVRVLQGCVNMDSGKDREQPRMLVNLT